LTSIGESCGILTQSICSKTAEPVHFRPHWKCYYYGPRVVALGMGLLSRLPMETWWNRAGEITPWLRH